MKKENIVIYEPESKIKKFFIDVLDIIAFVIFIIGVFIFLKVFVVAVVNVDGESMLPNYKNGEFIMLDKVSRKLWGDIKRADVVVAMPPTSNVSYLKRIIGLPGETVEITGGKVYICKTKQEWEKYQWTDVRENKKFKDKNLVCKQLIEPYIEGKTVNKRWFEEKIVTEAKCEVNKFKLYSGQYLVLGDDRMYSLDSRCCFMWTCKWNAKYYLTKDEILGKIIDFKKLFWK